MKHLEKILFAAVCLSLFSCGKDEDAASSQVQTPADPDPMPIVDSDVWREQIKASIRTDVLNEAYYKDVFMDGGIKLTSRTTLPACDSFKLSLEYFTAEVDVSADSLAQKEIFTGNDMDHNGILLFPDGAPRYKVFYSNGGKSGLHGESLMAPGRNAVRSFNFAGGSYVGSCAGAFLASAKRNNDFQSQYYGIWPGSATESGLSDSSTGMFVDAGSPLLNYFNFGGDNYIADVRHNGGCYYENTMMGTEILARYDRSDKSMHNNASIWAWKPSPDYGRVICCGSHPEGVETGERLHLMAAMLFYAIDGRGLARAKAILGNGESYVCDKDSNDDDPYHAKIGDGQCHHFVTAIPKGAKNVRIRLDYKGDYDIRLLLKNGTFAFDGASDYSESSASGAKELRFDSLESGIWYIGVYNASRPEVSTSGNGFCNYTARTELLNGIAYSLSVSWE